MPILLLLSVAANVYFVVRWSPGEVQGDVPTPESAAPVADSAPAATPEPTPEPTPPPPAGPSLLRASVDGPLVSAFAAAAPSEEEGTRVALVSNRLIGFWLDVGSDARKGDETAVLYDVDDLDPTDIIVYGLSYRSQKMATLYEAFRYQPAGWAFPSWFDGNGTEIPPRLDPAPIKDYEQITSLVGDGRKHGGMDFKAPVGTDVFATFAGTVKRVNWNWKFNGNSIEIAVPNGRLVRYLHLSEVDVKAGGKVSVGQKIGKSGNTGRSFAPHLHYEIEDSNGRKLDPLKVHEASHRALAAPDKAAFDAEVARFRASLAGVPAPSAAPAPATASSPAAAPAAAPDAVPPTPAVAPTGAP
jgi:murein DD-endopeptidase MepM/ murein hydrolase activator NlpD